MCDINYMCGTGVQNQVATSYGTVYSIQTIKNLHLQQKLYTQQYGIHLTDSPFDLYY